LLYGVTDKVEATSHEWRLFVVQVKWRRAETDYDAAGFDGNPVYSPDGKYIAYHAQ